ncbi:hypothetical protein [Psychrobacter aquimaris]|uniref:hypothetical protein n=1 Tax=Psychrobacter aquimaris TaxID=292733 RepID=UPI003FD2D329
MGLVDKLLEPTKNYINFRDLLFHLSSFNNEPLYDVATYLSHHIESLSFYHIDTDYKITPSDAKDQESIRNSLSSIQQALLFVADDWVFSSVNSLNELSTDIKSKLGNLIISNIHYCFKKSELLDFEPLNGLLHFEGVDIERKVEYEVIDNPIDRDLDQNDQNYISALKYVNDLGKGIGSGKPLKLALEYLVKNISFDEVKLYLYDDKEKKYFLVSQTDALDYTTSIKLLEGICHSLDGSQWGINFSDTALKPFKYFYFEYSELPDLRSSGDDTAVPKKSNQSSKRLPPPNLLERDKTGTPEVGHAKPKTYEQLVKDLATANNRIRQQDIDINRLSDQLNEQENKPIEDKELPYNSQMGVARMLHTILTMHKYDLSATKGKTNSLIERASQSNGTPVTRNFIAQWIDLANQAKSDSTK